MSTQTVSPNKPNQLIFTDAAAAKVQSLIEEEANPNLNLRVFITGGGCSGFQYGFTFDDSIQSDDIIIEKQIAANDQNYQEEDDDGGEGGDSSSSFKLVKLLVDPMSYQYLKGAEIDYREDINGSQFVIRNPNAKTTCGCGSSFST